MRIGIETQRLHGPKSGPQIYLTQLCKGLLRQDDDIKLVCFQFSNDYHELFASPRVEQVELSSIPGLTEQQLKSLDVDVLHLGAGLHRYPFLWRIDTPTVATIHGIEPLVLDDYQAPFKIKIQKKYIWPNLARFLDRIIVVSNSAKHQLVDNYPVSGDRVFPVYNGINHDRFSPCSEQEIEAVLDEYEINRPFYISVSGYSTRKNPSTLISAFDHAAAELANHALVIVGPGWEVPEVDRLIAECKHAQRIQRIGTVPESDLPALYSGATGLFSPTRHENFGLTLIEAMACGTSVIASGVYAVPEITGEAAILVDDPDNVDEFASKLSRLASDESLRNNLRKAGISRAAKFTWTQCTEDTLNVYSDML